jgi:hypothetical protein
MLAQKLHAEFVVVQPLSSSCPPVTFIRTDCEYFFLDSKASGIMPVTFAQRGAGREGG